VVVTARYFDPEPVLRLAGAGTDEEVGVRLGVSALTVCRWRNGRVCGMRVDVADRVARELGLHPSNVWGDDWWSGDA
jgi:hypothetical protein